MSNAEGSDYPGMVEPGYVPPVQRPVPTEGAEGAVETGYATPYSPVRRPSVVSPGQAAKIAAGQARVAAGGAPAGQARPAPEPVMNSDQTDAWAFVKAELADWKLGDLANIAKDLIINGAGREEVHRVISETDTYKTRFSGMEARRKAGFGPIDEATYVRMEDDYKSTMRAYGLPTGLYDDPSDFANYIGQNISSDEFHSRVADGYQWALEADPVEKAQLAQLYGLNDGDFAAMALDPDKAMPFLQKRRAATEIAAQASRTGWGQLTASEAEDLQGLGINEQTAAQGFGQLKTYEPLFQQAIGETGGDFSRAEQLGAQFGNDVTQQQRITRRQRQRRNAGQAGGTAVTTGSGVTGLGSVS